MEIEGQNFSGQDFVAPIKDVNPSIVSSQSEEPTSVNVGEVIRKMRLEQGIGSRELARNIGVSSSYLTDIEKDRRTPSERVLKSVADSMGLDLDYLMAISGRWGEIGNYIMKHPGAFTLFRRITEANLNDSALAKLSDALYDIEKSQNPSLEE